jgi:hypothetical protein
LFGLSGTQTAAYLGQTVDATAVILRTTLLGDATLDGAVDFQDLVKLAQNYGAGSSTASWSTGDFTYDGRIDFADLVQLAQNYDGSIGASDLPATSAKFEADLTRAFASVPEPAGLSLLGVPACALARRARRKRPRTNPL